MVTSLIELKPNVLKANGTTLIKTIKGFINF